MICPVCKSPMIVVEHERIELDHCPNCRGVWFDSGELELVLALAKLDSPGQVIGNLLNLPPGKASQRKLKCPICNRPMKVSAIGQPPIDIDVCRQGHGLWFDGGELHELLTQLAGRSAMGEGSEQGVLSFLKEVFQALD